MKRLMTILVLSLLLGLWACDTENEKARKETNDLFLSAGKLKDVLLNSEKIFKETILPEDDGDGLDDVVIKDDDDKVKPQEEIKPSIQNEKRDITSSSQTSQNKTVNKTSDKTRNDLVTSDKKPSDEKKEEKPIENKPIEEKPLELPKEEVIEETNPEVIEEASFDVTPYVAYANEYARSIGLNIDPNASGCWDNPISANAQKTSIKGDIKSRLDRYKNIEGFSAVYIWSEKIDDTSYNIYIGYY